ncbi:hypothetical protein [Archangium lipolyticum]|uniref:hypothetical protein n=1 Tax=Archangium lipolyticum TaxID=2970465 RepID=UPI00214A45A5|nr:hypothetical protein [Archangium lipolyticum]
MRFSFFAAPSTLDKLYSQPLAKVLLASGSRAHDALRRVMDATVGRKKQRA